MNKDKLMRYDCSKFKKPFRVGRKSKTSILDANGLLVVIFNYSEKQAKMYVDYLNEF